MPGVVVTVFDHPAGFIVDVATGELGLPPPPVAYEEVVPSDSCAAFNTAASKEDGVVEEVVVFAVVCVEKRQTAELGGDRQGDDIRKQRNARVEVSRVFHEIDEGGNPSPNRELSFLVGIDKIDVEVEFSAVVPYRSGQNGHRSMAKAATTP